MSFMMVAEFEAGASLGDVAAVMEELHWEFELTDSRMDGYLPQSSASFFFKQALEPGGLTAEGIEVDWFVGMSGVFHYRADNMMMALDEIFAFVRSYASMSSSRLVLSFQYEVIHAIRTDEGLKIFDWRSDSSS